MLHEKLSKMVVEFAATSNSTHNTKNIKQLSVQIDKTSHRKQTM